MPRYLDRRELVTRLASNQLRVEELELWAEPLRDSIAGTVASDLAALLGEGRIARLPWTGPSPPEAVVSIELRRFERTASRTIELDATWTITDGGDATVQLRRNTRLTLPVGSDSTQAAVAVMSQSLATMSSEIAAGLSRPQRAP